VLHVCTASPTTAIRLVPSSPISKGSQGPPCTTFMATRAIAAATIPTGSRSGSGARSAGSPKPSVPNAPSRAVEPAIGHLKEDHRMRRNYLKGREAAHRARCRRLQLRPASALVGGIVIACPVMILCRGLPDSLIENALAKCIARHRKDLEVEDFNTVTGEYDSSN
jgi:hypothetical protein